MRLVGYGEGVQEDTVRQEETVGESMRQRPNEWTQNVNGCAKRASPQVNAGEK
jgi:hypothetical protein